MSELRKIRDQIDAKFEELKQELQSGCSHEDISDWIEEWWVPGHPTGYLIKLCNRCGKEIERSQGFIKFETKEGDTSRKVHVYTPEELNQMKEEEEKAFKKLKDAYERERPHG